jgi:hypothetical protein
MPRYYCDYCDMYLTNYSTTGRKQHNYGWKQHNYVRENYSIKFVRMRFHICSAYLEIFTLLK